MRKIAVVTTSRADYGLLRHSLQALRADRRCAVQLVVSGTHLERRFGHTIDEIERDGMPIGARVRTPIRSDSGADAARVMGRSLQGFATAFERLAPDIVVVLGDRYEMLAAACAAALAGAVIAHLHGGEVTAGSLDEGWRHAITKIAHLHLVTTAEFARRIRMMGEPRHNIRVVGSPGVEALWRTTYLDRKELGSQLGATVSSPLAVVTYHPVTNDPAATRTETRALVAALDRSDLATIVVTASNADPGSDLITDAFREAARRDRRYVLVHSLGSQRYHSLMKLSDVMVGNSSSGIIEAPSLGLPVVNVGSRQDGRPRVGNVIDVRGTTGAIERAIRLARRPSFRARARRVHNPYDGGRTSDLVARFLSTVELTTTLRRKSFVDVRGVDLTGR